MPETVNRTGCNIALALLCLSILAACGGGDGEGDQRGKGQAGFDANGDGKADLILESGADTTPWRFGIAGSARFDTSTTLAQTFDAATHTTGKAIAAADANGDGRDDLLVQLETVDGFTQWKVFLSDGTTSTRTIGELSMPAGDDARALAFADIDGDGLADILLQQQMPCATCLRGA